MRCVALGSARRARSAGIASMRADRVRALVNAIGGPIRDGC
jgi:hypothetical protein